MKQGIFEALIAEECSKFLQEIYPDVWECYVRYDLDTLRKIYGIKYYIFDE